MCMIVVCQISAKYLVCAIDCHLDAPISLSTSHDRVVLTMQTRSVETICTESKGYGCQWQCVILSSLVWRVISVRPIDWMAQVSQTQAESVSQPVISVASAQMPPSAMRSLCPSWPACVWSSIVSAQTLPDNSEHVAPLWFCVAGLLSATRSLTLSWPPAAMNCCGAVDNAAAKGATANYLTAKYCKSS